MSLARSRVLGLCCRSARAPLFAAPSRLASSDSHSNHYEDTNVYPQESFNTSFWRNTLIISLVGVGLYNLVPYIDKDGDYITRYIKHYTTPGDIWARINQRHLEQATHAAQGQLLVSGAERPRVMRMRNPGSFDHGSPHCNAVGGQVDVSNVVVRKDKAWTE